MPGKKYASIKRPKMYEGLRRRGFSKQAAARISNASAKGGRKTSSRMRTGGRRAAGTRKTKRVNRRRR